MLEPRTDLKIHVRGGYREGSRGRFTAIDHFSCINCEEKFSNRRELGFHQMKCPYYQFVHPPNDQTIKRFKCVKCGMKFDDNRYLTFHLRRCGYYVSMKLAVTDDTAADDDISSVRDNANRSDISANNESNGVGEVVDVDTENNPSLDESSGSENQVDTEAEKYQDEMNNNAGIEMGTKITEDMKLSSRKRGNEDMCSDESSEFLKRAKVAQNEAPLYDTLVHDLEQERQQNVFDRVSARERPYKCSKCNVKFKYKNKYDFHVKFVHNIPGLVTSSHVTDFREIKMGESSSGRLEQAGSFANDQNSSDLGNTEARDPSIGLTRTNGIKSKVGNYPCEFCHLSFRYYSRRERHVKSVHKKQTEQVEFWNIFSCSHCKDRFPDKRSLMKHYSRTHMRNGKSPKDVNNEQFVKDLNVGDVMRHLRRNLLCLQDDTDFEKIRKHEDREFRLDIADNFRDRNVKITGSQLKVSRGESTSPHYNGCRVADISDHGEKNATQDTFARKRKFDICHYFPRGNASEDVHIYKCSNSSPNNPHLEANDAPIDLSLKSKRKEEPVNPCNTRGDNTADDKAKTSERALLMEYYKDFIQEYCMNEH